MPVPSTGPIGLSQNIKGEFGPFPLTPPLYTGISSYYRGGFFVRNTGVNAGIPTAATKEIKFSQFRGGVRYVGSVGINIVAETSSRYANSNNGYVQVVVNGNSPSFTVSCTGRNAETLTAGQIASFYSYDSTVSVIITVTDTSGTYNFGPFTIGYASATQTYNFTL